MTLQEYRFAVVSDCEAPRAVDEHSATVLCRVDALPSASMNAELATRSCYVRIPTGPAHALTANQVESWNAFEPASNLSRMAIGSVFSRDSVAPPSPSPGLSYFQAILERRGRSAALDALVDYLDNLVISGDIVALDAWLQRADVNHVAAELLATVLVVAGPVRPSLASFGGFATKAREYLTRVEGEAATESLLEGLV